MVYNDITEEKKEMEEVLAARRYVRYDRPAEPDPHLNDGSLLYGHQANPAYVQMSGYARDRIMGMSLRDVKIREQKGEGAKVAIQRDAGHSAKSRWNSPAAPRFSNST